MGYSPVSGAPSRECAHDADAACRRAGRSNADLGLHPEGVYDRDSVEHLAMTEGAGPTRSIWDALIVEAAREAGAEVLYTEDRRLLRAVNGEPDEGRSVRGGAAPGADQRSLRAVDRSPARRPSAACRTARRLRRGQSVVRAEPVHAGCGWCADRPCRRSTRRTSMSRPPTASLTHVPPTASEQRR